MKAEYELVSPEEFPTGLVCGYCQRFIECGQPYASRLHSMYQEIPIVELICVYCAYRENE